MKKVCIICGYTLLKDRQKIGSLTCHGCAAFCTQNVWIDNYAYQNRLFILMNTLFIWIVEIAEKYQAKYYSREK